MRNPSAYTPGSSRRPASRTARACLPAIAFSAVLLAACGPGRAAPPRDPAALRARAAELSARLLIADGHIDYPDRASPYEDLTAGTSGNFDEPRARKGGLNLAFLAAYVPPEDEDAGTAFSRAEERIDLVLKAADIHPDKLALARSPEEARVAFGAGRLALAVGIENGAPLEGRLDRVGYFRDRGVAYIGLVHSEDNHLCDSSMEPDPEHRWNGLSSFGREVVREMNRLGLMVDVSHATDDAIRQILELSTAPVIASHSGLRSLTPGFERNLPDDLVRGVAESGGVVCLAFGSYFLRDAFRTTHAAADLATARDVAEAIDRTVRIVGVDHVGLGSDFDGVGFSLPKDLADVSMYVNLVRELLSMGYGEEDLAKILGGNLLRVWGEVRAKAEE
ncbi:MAG TPA: dipeptidase [Spirochaetia bacterium]|nr:dipeptidase [Spirochaetales bacterium]HRY79648.1 dipeptidase [Spirochaetia bacterium]HRZ89444.1 dipeptidase [Spirochaetia bacterium]